MKRTAALLLLIAGLSACAVEAPQATPGTGSAPAQTPAEVDPDWLFLQTVKAEYPAISILYTDPELIDIARTACDAIDEGMTVEGLATIIIDEGLDPALVGYIVGAGIGAYCSWNSGFFDGAGSF